MILDKVDIDSTNPIENEICSGGVLKEDNVSSLIAKYGMRYAYNRPGCTLIINIGK